MVRGLLRGKGCSIKSGVESAVIGMGGAGTTALGLVARQRFL